MARAVIKTEGSPDQKPKTKSSPSKKVPSHRVSPFPSYDDPTPEMCEQVNSLLESVHYKVERPLVIVDKSDKAGCGANTKILDGLIRTILSQNTTNGNADNAFNSMTKFYKGISNYEAVLNGPTEELEAAIKCGGLAGSKSKAIMAILQSCNQRRIELGQKDDELNLEWLRELNDEEVTKELLSFKGVGAKTASCTLMFAMGRESFAVDTHVWRLTKALSWVPESATRDQTFNHLDLRIPGHLKFPLHTLLVLHGRSCENCSAGGIVASEKKRAIKESDCPLRSLLTESEGGGLKKKKGAKGTAKGTGKGKKRKVESDESEEEEAISSEEEDYQDSDEEEKKPKLKKLKTKAKPKPKILIKSESKSPIKKIKISESEVESELSELEDDLPSSKVVKVEE